MTRLNLRLEEFGDSVGHRPVRVARDNAEALARARGEGHASGYSEGYAAGVATVEAEEAAAISALREDMHDLALRQESSRAEAISSLQPVIEAIVRAAAPIAAKHGLAASVAEAVEARLASAPQERLVVRVAPDRVAAMAGKLGDNVDVKADPAIDGARARLEWGGGGGAFDAEGCVNAALDAIGRFFGEAEEDLRNVG